MVLRDLVQVYATASRGLSDWLDAEPQLFRPADVDYVHSPERMSKMSKCLQVKKQPQ